MSRRTIGVRESLAYAAVQLVGVGVTIGQLASRPSVHISLLLLFAAQLLLAGLLCWLTYGKVFPRPMLLPPGVLMYSGGGAFVQPHSRQEDG